ncbi:MAG: YfhL family 4Fe-4S dicluster ferredoxin [Myxococcales bacterium]|jgi:ferredoxin|nr:YfhL family 4Fe-4S dicluster ferredoxin [Myxococcales bacterium]
MAYEISEECIACGACESECPNAAISQGAEIYEIHPARCTECVGFYDEAACAAVCPVNAPQPNPNLVESEATLLERARSLHADRKFPALEELPASMSHFKKQ